MKIPASMTPQILKMIAASLPYDDKEEYKSSQCMVILQVYELLCEKSDELKSMEGMVYNILNKIEKCPDKQSAVQDAIDKLKEILE